MVARRCARYRTVVQEQSMEDNVRCVPSRVAASSAPATYPFRATIVGFLGLGSAASRQAKQHDSRRRARVSGSRGQFGAISLRSYGVALAI